MNQHQVAMWVLIAPNGRIQPSTVSTTKKGAMKHKLDEVQKKYGALIEVCFAYWERHGWKVERVSLQRSRQRS